MNDAATPAAYRPRFASRTVLALPLCCWLVLLASPAWAEILYDREGIQLRGTARIVSHNAATCNVLEEKYSPEDYERLKANQGQPLHVWQLDISAHNNTGKPLDFLSAHFNIESPWPPCTNWSGEGPGGGPAGEFTDAEGRPKPLEWADTLKVLSMPHGMRVGQVERDTVFLVVFHEDRPVFKSWDVRFTFAQAGVPAQQSPQVPSSRQASPREVPSRRSQFPPEIMVDRHLIQVERLLAAKDHQSAREVLYKIVALQEEHDLTLPGEFHFRYAQAAWMAGSLTVAKDSVSKYLREVGRDGEFYREALELLDELERTDVAGKDAPTCAGQSKGAECWMEVTGQPGCYFWNDELIGDESVAWTGTCSGGRAQGKGTLKWVWHGGDKTSESTGSLTDGKRHGQWVTRNPAAGVVEGPYVDGKRHGQWVMRCANGGVAEILYVDGKPHGQLVFRFPDGTVHEGPSVDGKQHGHWVFRFPDGTVHEGPYVDGKQHGQWVYRRPDGTVVGKTTFVNGEQTD